MDSSDMYDDTSGGAAPLDKSDPDREEGVLKFGAGVNGGVQVNTGDMISGGYHAEYLDHSTEMIAVDGGAQEGADPLDSITSALEDQYPLDRLGEFPEYQLLMVDNQPPPSEKLRELLDDMAAVIEYKLRQRMKEWEDEGVPMNEELKQALVGVDEDPAAKSELAIKEYVDQLVAEAMDSMRDSMAMSARWVNRWIAEEIAKEKLFSYRFLLFQAICFVVGILIGMLWI